MSWAVSKVDLSLGGEKKGFLLICNRESSLCGVEALKSGNMYAEFILDHWGAADIKEILLIQNVYMLFDVGMCSPWVGAPDEPIRGDLL